MDSGDRQTESSILAKLANSSVMLALITLVFGLLSTNATLKVNSKKETLATEIAKEKELSSAQVKIREFLLIEQDHCTSGKYTGDQSKFRRAFIKKVFALVDANMVTDEIFDLEGAEKYSLLYLVYIATKTSVIQLSLLKRV